MTEKREFAWTKETKRADAERTTEAAFRTISGERAASTAKVERLRAARMAAAAAVPKGQEKRT